MADGMRAAGRISLRMKEVWFQRVAASCDIFLHLLLSMDIFQTQQEHSDTAQMHRTELKCSYVDNHILQRPGLNFVGPGYWF
jgi:hypothetical protein